MRTPTLMARSISMPDALLFKLLLGMPYQFYKRTGIASRLVWRSELSERGVACI